MSPLPLDGRRVLDLTRNVAGPYASMILGELGADVVKIEQPGRGDDTREWGPPFWGGQGPIFLAINRNKRSITLDLKAPEARSVVTRLASRSDVFLESFRPGVTERLGFDYEWAQAVNPGIIYCSVTPYGDRGPLKDRPGYDPLMQAFGGIMSVTGEEGRPPVRAGISPVDMGTGMWTAMTVLAALLQRGPNGPGQRIVTSLYETTLAWMNYHLVTCWAGGEPPRHQGSGTTTIAPYQAFRTSDGYLVIAAANDELFARLCRVLDHPSWADDERFRRNRDRVRNRDRLCRAIEEATAGRATEELADSLVAAGVPCSPIRDAVQVVADEQAAALGIFQAADHPRIPGYRSVAMPFLMGGSRPPLRRLPPGLGEHNREVLRELGYDDEEVARLLRSDAAVGSGQAGEAGAGEEATWRR